MTLTASDVEKAAGSLARVARRTELDYNEPGWPGGPSWTTTIG